MGIDWSIFVKTHMISAPRRSLINFLKRLWLPFAVFVLATNVQRLEAFAEQPHKPPSVKPEIAWPEVTQSARPWTRWWWHGSAVDEKNLTRLLEEYKAVGLGGVEITCIYGVKGNEARNRRYLSPEWIQAMQHTIDEVERLGMGVDLPAGSGWRMGGPSVKLEDANSKLMLEKAQVSAGEVFSRTFDKSVPQVIVAVADSGKEITLTDQISNRSLRWESPAGDSWTVYMLGYTWAGDRVKRPAPGGAGYNINPFSHRSVESYLAMFGEKLDQLPGIRAQFHDSFEYEGDWQPEFLDEFAKRRGYHVEEYLPALAGDGSKDQVARVKCDYRETLSDLVLDSACRTMGKLGT